MQDDGAGLALSRLSKMGRERGILKEDSNPNAVAELIFHEGLSTSSKISQISGRGIGMSAVRKFLEGIGGIIIEFSQTPNLDQEFCPFTFVVLYP